MSSEELRIKAFELASLVHGNLCQDAKLMIETAGKIYKFIVEASK